jgi:hypothetical protein
VAGTSIIRTNPEIPGGPTGQLPAASLDLAQTLYYGEDTHQLFRCRNDGSAWDLIAVDVELDLERAMVIGKAGALPTLLNDGADFPLVVPFDMTLRRMKSICAIAPTTNMVVQLRLSTDPLTPSYSDVAGFTTTFTAAQQSATVDPDDFDVSEGDVLNLSITSGSGQNMLTEIVGVAR